MGISQIIVDTDEDDDGDSSCANSPERTLAIGQLRDSEQNTASVQTPSTDASSTDPSIFKAVYKEHLGMTPSHSDELRNSYPLLTDHNSVSRPVMSSSMAGDGRLKRSRTINTSSLASTGEHSELGRKAKREKSMNDLDDVLKVTTLKKSRYLKEKDILEFPESSISEDVNSTVNAVILKTYERLRRSHSTIDGMRENNGHEPKPLFNHEGNQSSAQNSRSPYGKELLTASKTKRIRRTISGRTHESDDSPRPSEYLVQKITLPQDVTRSNSMESSSVQIQTSTNQTHSPPAILSSPVKSDDEEFEGSLIQIRGGTAILDPPLTMNSPMVQQSESTRSSVVIIPATLTEEQRLQYSIVNVASSGQSRSPLEIKDSVEPNSKYLSGNSTELHETHELATQLQAGQTSTSAILLSSSPQIPSASQRMKRAHSEIGTRQSMPSVILGSSSKITKRRGRSKTTVFEEVLPSGAFVDELSLSPAQAVGTIVSTVHVPVKDGNKINMKISQQGTIADEDLDRKMMQQEEELDNAKGNLSNIASMKRAIDSAGESDIIEAPNSSKQVRRDSVDILIEPDALPPIVPNQPKKRGRKKTSELTGSKLKDKPQAPVLEPIYKAPSTEPSPALCEANRNIQADPSKDRSSTPSTAKVSTVEVNPFKILADPIAGNAAMATTPELNFITSKASPKAASPPQTLIKDRENAYREDTEKQTGSQQHSPLQNGKVPYRVGLSKRKMIAPLLKIIRK